jgi:DNA polymerase IIIc chi subunit
MKPRVVFYQVRDNLTKLQRIAQTAASHFEKNEPFLILVEDQRSQGFVDELLWKEGFLPHIATDLFTSEKVAITKTKANVNQAMVAFNLCPTPLLIDGPFRIIYDFEDLTAPSKKNFSSLRYDAYKKAGYLIEAR